MHLQNQERYRQPEGARHNFGGSEASPQRPEDMAVLSHAKLAHQVRLPISKWRSNQGYMANKIQSACSFNNFFPTIVQEM
jgi:hypothetical protein